MLSSAAMTGTRTYTILDLLLLVLTATVYVSFAQNNTTEPAQDVTTKIIEEPTTSSTQSLTTGTKEVTVPQAAANAQIQPTTSLASFVNLNFSQITTESVVISWDVAADIADNITTFTLNVTASASDKVFKEETVSKSTTEYVIENGLQFSTKYEVCLDALADDGIALFDEPACQNFVTLYNPLNRHAIGAVACSVMIVFLFILFKVLEFGCKPDEASSEKLKQQMLKRKEDRRAERKLLGKSADENFYEREKDRLH